jgi:hypothetical protein
MSIIFVLQFVYVAVPIPTVKGAKIEGREKQLLSKVINLLTFPAWHTAIRDQRVLSAIGEFTVAVMSESTNLKKNERLYLSGMFSVFWPNISGCSLLNLLSTPGASQARAECMALCFSNLLSSAFIDPTSQQSHLGDRAIGFAANFILVSLTKLTDQLDKKQKSSVALRNFLVLIQALCTQRPEFGEFYYPL